MKALLDDRGFLKIARNNGEFTDQFCPTREVVFCGTWCPLFGEIEEISGSQVRIPICQGRLLRFTEVQQEGADTNETNDTSELPSLKELRESQGLSLREMSKQCGVDKATLSRLEHGLINNLTERTERKIASGYRIITRVIRRDLCELSCTGIDIKTLRSGKIKKWYDGSGEKPAIIKMFETIDICQRVEGA